MLILGDSSGYSQNVPVKNFTIKRGDTFTFKLDKFISSVNSTPYDVDLGKCVIVAHIKEKKTDHMPFKVFDTSVSDDNELILHLLASTTKDFEPKKYYYDIQLLWTAPEYGTNEDEYEENEINEIIIFDEDGNPITEYEKRLVVQRHVTILRGYIKFTRDITIIDVVKDITYKLFLGFKTKYKEYPAIRLIVPNLLKKITKVTWFEGTRLLVSNFFYMSNNIKIYLRQKLTVLSSFILSNVYKLYPVNTGITPNYTINIVLKITYYIIPHP